MRAFAGLLWASVALKTYTASAQALLYTSEALISPSKDGLLSISPLTARLLLAQRLGLSQYHTLEDADDSTIEVLNKHGSRRRGVFEDEDQTDTEKLLLVIEGVSNPEDIFDPSMRPSLIIENAPSSLHNEELVSQLLKQDHHSRSGYVTLRELDSSKLRGGFSASCKSYDNLMRLDNIFKSEQSQLSKYTDFRKQFSSLRCDSTIIVHIITLQNLTPKDSARYTTALSELKAFISHFLPSTDPISSTILLTPPPIKSSKRTATSPYGTFIKPRQQPPQPEEPLTTPSSHLTSHLLPPKPLQATNSTPSALPHGPLPSCYPSLSAAITATNNCSGHGTAYNKTSSDSEGKACYACKCVPTVLQVEGGGTKTIYWGGPACQKKDISVPFFLLAGLSIALIGIVTWGVGLMASIGQEELPSVIGAGVTGPRAHK